MIGPLKSGSLSQPALPCLSRSDTPVAPLTAQSVRPAVSALSHRAVPAPVRLLEYRSVPTSMQALSSCNNICTLCCGKAVHSEASAFPEHYTYSRP